MTLDLAATSKPGLTKVLLKRISPGGIPNRKGERRA